MLVVLDGKTLIALLVHMAQPARMIMGMVTHGMRPTNPFHETAHFAIDQRAQHEMVVIRHQLIAEQFQPMAFQSFGEDPLKRTVVSVLVEDRRSEVPANKGVI